MQVFLDKNFDWKTQQSAAMSGAPVFLVHSCCYVKCTSVAVIFKSHSVFRNQLHSAIPDTRHFILNQLNILEARLKWWICDMSFACAAVSREALQDHQAYKQRCNAFFMALVSRLCFTKDTPPDEAVVHRLLGYVTRESQVARGGALRTKKMSVFADDGIDPTPVVRSFLLQLLLRSEWEPDIMLHMFTDCVGSVVKFSVHISSFHWSLPILKLWVILC